MGGLSHLAHVQAVALFVAAISTGTTAQAAIEILQPTGANLPDRNLTVEFTQDGDACDTGSLYIEAGANVYADMQWTYTAAGPSPFTVGGLPDDGTAVDIFISCTSYQNETDSRSYLINSYNAAGGAGSRTDGDTGTSSGTVTLAEGSMVTLAPDAALTLDSGLTNEQFEQLAVAILLSLVTAIGIRQLLKVLT